MKMKDLDSMDIEQIIRLPFFYSLKKSDDPVGMANSTKMWEITFRCNKIFPNGKHGLLDAESESEYMVRYKLIDFK